MASVFRRDFTVRKTWLSHNHRIRVLRRWPLGNNATSSLAAREDVRLNSYRRSACNSLFFDERFWSRDNANKKIQATRVSPKEKFLLNVKIDGGIEECQRVSNVCPFFHNCWRVHTRWCGATCARASRVSPVRHGFVSARYFS